MNNNIQEDYVSFEIAKLLKEKGFNNPCRAFYLMPILKELGEVKNIFQFASNLNKKNGIVYHQNQFQCQEALAPTHALAIKWIRENFGVHIEILSPVRGSTEWIYIIYEIGKTASLSGTIGGYNSFEEAESAGILYTLTNLT